MRYSPFQEATIYLEGNTPEGHHGSIWEVYPVFEALIQHLDKMKKRFPKDTFSELADSINLAWSKLDDYYTLIDKTPAYMMAMVLHPRYKYAYFKKKWAGQAHLKKYFNIMKLATRKIHDEDYKLTPVPKYGETQESQAPVKGFFDSYMDDILNDEIDDEFKYYVEGDPELLPKNANLYQWWSNQTHLSTVQQAAYDYLSIPAMSAECERVFSDTKRTITTERNRLKDDIIEATECLVWWMRNGL